MKKLITALICLGLVISIGITLIAGIFGAVSGSQDSDCSTLPTGNAKSTLSSSENNQDIFLSDEAKEEIAWQTYSVLSEWGMPNNKAIGAVANGDAESGLNPAKVESDYVSSWQKFTVGSDEYWEAIRKNGGPTVELLFNRSWSEVAPQMKAGDEGGYVGSDPNGHHWLGFSMFQRTGYAGVKPYFDWTAEKGYDPVATDTVLLGLVSDLSDWYKKYTPQGDYYYKRVVRVRDDVLDGKDAATPADGAEIWLRFYEYEVGWNLSINSVMNLPHRQELATKWAVILGKKGVDKDYARSILSQADVKSAKSNSQKNNDPCGARKSSSGKVNATGHPYDVPYILASYFGFYGPSPGGGAHAGVDFNGVPFGEAHSIYNLLDGEVVSAGGQGDSPSGFCVSIWQGETTAVIVKSENVGGYDELWLNYWHLRTGSTTVKVGDKVVAGQELGIEGHTGCSTGQHLHLQATDKGPGYWISSDPSTSLDPSEFIAGLEKGNLDGYASNRLPYGSTITPPASGSEEKK